jgi:hypothetical protein
MSFDPFIIVYQPKPYRKQALGSDFDFLVSKTIVRGEVVYNITKGYESETFIPNPDISYVFGVEQNLFGITTIVQYVGKYTIDFKELDIPNYLDIIYETEVFNRKIFNQQEELNHAFMLMLNRMFYYDQLELVAAGYYNITSDEYFARAGLTWKISDLLSVTLGYNNMGGPDESIYYRTGKALSAAFAELKVSF